MRTRTSRRRVRGRQQPRTFAPRFEVLEDRRVMATDVILEWNDVLLTANAADHARSAPEQGGPILTARAFAIVSAAMYDAYNSIERMGAPYLVKVELAGQTDSEAAVAQAAHDTLTAMFPSQQARFDAALAETLARVPDGLAENRGITVGAAVAAEILNQRANDGAGQLGSPAYVPNHIPGFHIPDPMHPNQGFYGSGGLNVAAFVIDDLDQFAARRLDDATPAGRAAFLQSAEYTAAYNEVFALGGDGVTSPTTRTSEQGLVGLYWAYDGRPGLGTPPRLYNQIARTVAHQQHNTVADNARLFALLNIAQADAGQTAWKNKYDDAFWRPVAGVRGGEGDGNPATQGDANWVPMGAPASNPRAGETDFTPPFPAYTSGHATFGAAAFQVLERFYGRDDIRFTFVSDELNGITRGADGNVRPLGSRTFDSFTQAKLENGQSRIYLGIHWAMDRDDGIKTGDAVADYIFEHAFQANSPPSDPLRHNFFDPLDVNDDGTYSPVDVLLVINVLNAGSVISTDYIDVNDDDFATPLDALLVINRLNLVPPGAGEGEGFVPWVAEQQAAEADQSDSSVLPLLLGLGADGSSADTLIVSPSAAVESNELESTSQPSTGVLDDYWAHLGLLRLEA